MPLRVTVQDEAPVPTTGPPNIAPLRVERALALEAPAPRRPPRCSSEGERAVAAVDAQAAATAEPQIGYSSIDETPAVTMLPVADTGNNAPSIAHHPLDNPVRLAATKQSLRAAVWGIICFFRLLWCLEDGDPVDMYDVH